MNNIYLLALTTFVNILILKEDMCYNYFKCYATDISSGVDHSWN